MISPAVLVVIMQLQCRVLCVYKINNMKFSICRRWC